MSLIDLRAARAEVSLAVVLQLLDWRARTRHGKQVRGPCPVHGSKTPDSRSFSAHLGRNVWRCFRCAAGGNALDLWAAVTGQELYPAVLELYQRLGRAVPWLEPARGSSAPKDQRERRIMSDP
jgi:DNA primase